MHTDINYGKAQSKTGHCEGGHFQRFHCNQHRKDKICLRRNNKTTGTLLSFTSNTHKNNNFTGMGTIYNTSLVSHGQTCIQYSSIMCIKPPCRWVLMYTKWRVVYMYTCITQMYIVQVINQTKGNNDVLNKKILHKNEHEIYFNHAQSTYT